MRKTCLLLLILTLTACAGSATPVAEPTRYIPPTLDPNIEPTEFLPTLAPTAAVTPKASLAATTTRTPGGDSTPVATLSATDWQKWPVVPAISPRMKAVYQKGIELGNNPNTFSKVGDCQNVSSFFLGVYDKPDDYRLGEYKYLQKTIDYFDGSFSRNSIAVRGGYNVASVLSSLWADPAACQKGESPLVCEFRHQRPSIVFISMETWWSGKPVSEYESYLRQIVEYALEQGAVPILATKADNWEGDHRINAAIARVAADYDVPLWNFWLAVQPLPNHGMSEDGFHLTYARNFFNDPVRMQSAWPVRNLTALQSLEAVWQAVK